MLTLGFPYNQPGAGLAERFSEEIAQGVKRWTTVLQQLVQEGLRLELDEMTVV
jgi:hypothetical protein